jgi:hypothetical protein
MLLFVPSIGDVLSRPREVLEILVLLVAALAAYKWVIFPLLDAGFSRLANRNAANIADAVLDVVETSRKEKAKRVIGSLFVEELGMVNRHEEAMAEMGRSMRAIELNVERNSTLLGQIPGLQTAVNQGTETMKFVGDAVVKLAEVLDVIRDDHHTIKGYLKAADLEKWDRIEKRMQERRQQDAPPPDGVDRRSHRERRVPE